jgi:DNA-binding Lrp family transcriptional regulator
MMMEAYILVVISSQHELYGFGRSVIEKLGAVRGVERAELLFGDYDAILKVKMPSIDDIETLIIEEISLIEGVNDTITLLCVDEAIL